MKKKSEFYLIYPPGLVHLGLLELHEYWDKHFKAQLLLDEDLTILSVDEGGLLISCDLHEGLLLNHLLKSPTRILLRIAEFKARDFPKLFNKISKLPWKDYLCGQEPEVVTVSTNSKLFDSRKISKAVIDGINECYKKQPVKKKYLDLALDPKIKDELPSIYFRAVDDVVTMSIDTTGERLHKRGDKLLSGLAPIRENIAALLLRALKLGLDVEPLDLIDPMCGSGTFLIEAHDSHKIIKDRSFAYQYFPMILSSNELNLKKETLASLNHSPFKSITGFDINPEIVKLAKLNCEERSILIKEADLFKSEKSQSESSPLIIINPPYGHRIGEKSEITLSYYVHLLITLKNVYRPQRIGIIIPDEYHYKAKPSELVASYSFKNGGIPVTFFVLNTLGS